MYTAGQSWVGEAGHLSSDGRPRLAGKDDGGHEALTERQRAAMVRALTTLSRAMAHDFNNLLMGIRGCASIARDHLEATHPAALFIDEIVRAAEDGGAITRPLSALSPNADFELAPVVVDERLDRSARTLRTALGPEATLILDLQAGVAAVETDARQLDTMLEHLIRNAREAGARHLWLSTEVVDGPTGALAGARRGSLLRLRFDDDGRGMSSRDRDRAVEPFFTTKSAAAGLGLTMAQAIARRSGGELRISGEPGRGTRIEVLLPVANGPHAITEDGADDVAPCAPATILLCEDEDVVRRATRHHLQRAGHCVLSASSGAEALRWARQGTLHIDLFLTDIALKGESGDQLARQIRELRPGIGLLYMSAYAHDWLTEEGLIMDGVTTLQKPFDDEYLLRHVHAVLARLPRAPTESI